MQKLTGKLKNTPRNTSLVPCSVNFELNRVQRLSAQDKVRTVNNSEENLAQQTERSLKANVFVLSKSGNPLMPCSHAKSKRLVKKGAAKVVKRFPFTIKLNFDCKEKVQEITLGIDPGYENVGISARTESKEVLRLEIKLRKDVSAKLTEKRMYRRGRRNRLWYREPRFLNRGIKQGWLAPSIKHRLDTHVRLINKISKYLPVSKVIVEVANFDIQKINNPDIQGIEYQQGNLYGYENAKSHLIAREHAKCQLCGEKSTKANSFRVHHIIQRKDGGTDKPANLVLLHEKCHKKVHKKGLKFNKNKQFKAETFMSMVRWKLKEELAKIVPTDVTFGHITKVKRYELNLDKSHSNDAFVIAEGTNQVRLLNTNLIQKRRNNRCLQLNRKGFKPSIRKQRYPIQPNDLVKINGKVLVTKGSHCKGTRVLVNGKSVNVKLLDKWKFNSGNFINGDSNSPND